MSAEDWASVIRVHLCGMFVPTPHAAAYWRQRSKDGHAVDARVIYTSSSSGLFSNPGQTNYGAAKSGIATFTIVTSKEPAWYGVTVNATYPAALSRLTEALMPSDDAPAKNAPLVVWLASGKAREVTGRVFGVFGNQITVAEGCSAGPRVDSDRACDPAGGRGHPRPCGQGGVECRWHGRLPGQRGLRKTSGVFTIHGKGAVR
jgi:short chain dehydrogenase